MKLNGAWIFYGRNSYEIRDLAERFRYVSEVNDALVRDLMEHLIHERRDSAFMAMGLGESLRRATIKHGMPIVIDDVEYVPELWSISGNGFAFSWVVNEAWELPEQFRKKA